MMVSRVCDVLNACHSTGGILSLDCSAFHRQGQRYEVELDGLGCVRCPTPLEILGLAGVVAGVVLLFALLVGVYTRFARKYPEHSGWVLIVILFVDQVPMVEAQSFSPTTPCTFVLYPQDRGCGNGFAAVTLSGAPQDFAAFTVRYGRIRGVRINVRASRIRILLAPPAI